MNSDDSAAGNMPKGWNPMCDTPVICRKYAEVQHLSSMSEANYKKVMIESESIRVLCVCVALLSIL